MNELDYPKKLLELGDKEGGAKEIIRLLQKSPQNPDAWFLLAQTIDDKSKKTDCYRQILRYDPNNSLAQSELQKLIQKQTELPAPSLADSTQLKTSPLKPRKLKPVGTPRFTDNAAQLKASPLIVPQPKEKNIINDETMNDYRNALSLIEKKFGILLDNSEHSLAQLDNFISIEVEEFSKGPINNKQFRDEIGVILVALSIVFGEIVRVNLGGNWVYDPDLSKKMETINETFIIKEKNLVDPFYVIFNRVLKGMPINLLDFYNGVENLYKGTLEISSSIPTSQKQRMAWMCPNCNSPNHTPVELYTQTFITCPSSLSER